MSNNNVIDLLYRFMAVKGVGPVQANKLIVNTRRSGAIEEIEHEIKKVLSSEQLVDFEQKESALDEVTHKFNVRFFSLYDSEYPEELQQTLKINTPPVFSYIGNIDLLKKKKIAFSGSRKVSEKGLKITRQVVEQVIEKEMVVVSGNAQGVDMEAHRTALERGGDTIFVLPEGINYFSVKKELKKYWDEEHVLVVSEFKPTDKWMAGRAMQRNNTILGLSDGVFVIEAGETGGSLAAGLKSLELHKPLFVPKYSEFPESALGNPVLLRKGAIPLGMNKETHTPNLTKLFELLQTKNNLF